MAYHPLPLHRAPVAPAPATPAGAGRPAACASTAPLAPLAPPAAPAGPAAGPPAVLVVEGQALVRTVLCHYAERAGYRAIGAAAPAEGWAALASETGIALLVSDVRLPHADAGLHFIRRVRGRWPRLPVAVVTAFPDDLHELHGTPAYPDLVVSKPFRTAQMEEVLRLAPRGRA